MADLQYGDVQRAVQDGLKHMQNDLQKLTSDMQHATQQIQYTDETMRMVQDIQRLLQQFQPSIDNIHRRVTDANGEQRLATIQSDIQELKNRFTSVERFAAQMSDYLRQRHEDDREDREYRNG
jgi:septation ring formation regulator EzrA